MVGEEGGGEIGALPERNRSVACYVRSIIRGLSSLACPKVAVAIGARSEFVALPLQSLFVDYVRINRSISMPPSFERGQLE